MAIKKIGKMVVFMGACAVPILAGIWINDEKNQGGITKAENPYHAVSSVVNDELENNNSEIIAEGEGVSITLSEVNIRYRLQSLKSENITKEEVLGGVIADYALYQEAVEKGFLIREEELDAKVNELREAMKSVDNADEIQSFLDGFSSEEDYWKFVKEKSRVEYTILAYKDDLADQYSKKNVISRNNVSQDGMWDDFIKNKYEKAIENSDITIRKNVADKFYQENK